MEPESDKHTLNIWIYIHIYQKPIKTVTFNRRYWPSSQHTNSIKKEKHLKYNKTVSNEPTNILAEFLVGHNA